MFMISWGQDVYQIISFFLYERFNEDGTENYMVGVDGEEILIKNSEELYNTINKLYPGILD